MTASEQEAAEARLRSLGWTTAPDGVTWLDPQKSPHTFGEALLRAAAPPREPSPEEMAAELAKVVGTGAPVERNCFEVGIRAERDRAAAEAAELREERDRWQEEANGNGVDCLRAIVERDHARAALVAARNRVSDLAAREAGAWVAIGATEARALYEQLQAAILRG